MSNPYIYDKAIRDPRLLVGREAETDQADYYLRQLQEKQSSTNIAFVGPKGMGKTSLLNYVASRGNEIKACVAHCELDEGSVRTPLTFLYTIYDSILRAVTSFTRSYASQCDTTFATNVAIIEDWYDELTTVYSSNVDRTIFQLRFPTQYAQIRRANVSDADISRSSYKRDLQYLHTVVGAPIVLLVDEFHKACEAPITLELFRNTFVDLPGYWSVVAGLPETRQRMTQNCESLVRQFSWISVGSYEHYLQTQRCIQAPLEQAFPNVEAADSVAPFSRQEYLDIHRLTGGKPHEINRLGHHMYRRMEDQNAERMRLNIDVVESILSEIDVGSEPMERDFISRLRDLSGGEIELLGRLVQFRDAKLDNIARLYSAFNRTATNIKEDVPNLISKGFVTLTDEVPRLTGDDIDQIYFRYYAKTLGHDFVVGRDRLESFIVTVAGVMLNREAFDLRISGHLCDELLDNSSAASSLLNIDTTNGRESAFAQLSSTAIVTLYEWFADAICVGAKDVSFTRVAFESETLRFIGILVENPERPRNTEYDEQKLLGVWDKVGTRISLDKVCMTTPDTGELIKLVLQARRDAQKSLVSYLSKYAFDCYEKDDDTRALDLQLRLEAAISPDEDTYKFNNSIGYLALRRGDYEEAEHHFNMFKNSSDRDTKPIGRYNLAMLKFARGSLADAVADLHELQKSGDVLQNPTLCMLIPTHTGGQGLFEQHWRLSLGDAITLALQRLGAP